jgi:hypothetical protein
VERGAETAPGNGLGCAQVLAGPPSTPMKPAQRANFFFMTMDLKDLQNPCFSNFLVFYFYF